MTPRISIRAGILIVVLLLVARLTSEPGPVHTWKNSEGNKIKAELSGYNRKTKRIHWILPGNKEGSTPLASLNQKSKLDALLEPVVAEEAGWLAGYYFKNDPGSLFPLGLFLVIGIPALLTLDFLSFRFGLRVYHFSDRNFSAYLKQLAATTVAAVAAIFACKIAFQYIPYQPPNFIIGLAIGIFALLVGALILSRHYGVPAKYTAGVIFLGRLAFHALWVVVAYGVSWFIDPFVLEPLRMI